MDIVKNGLMAFGGVALMVLICLAVQAFWPEILAEWRRLRGLRSRSAYLGDCDARKADEMGVRKYSRDRDGEV